MRINMKTAMMTSIVGMIFLAITYFTGLLIVGIILFPMIWGLIYKFIQKQRR